MNISQLRKVAELVNKDLCGARVEMDVARQLVTVYFYTENDHNHKRVAFIHPDGSVDYHAESSVPEVTGGAFLKAVRAAVYTVNKEDDGPTIS